MWLKTLFLGRGNSWITPTFVSFCVSPEFKETPMQVFERMETKVLEMDSSTEVLSIAIHPECKTIASYSKDRIIKLWNWQTGEILGVDENAHGEDVKIAYRKLARLYHPDINNTDTAKAAMQVINQAYQHFQRLVNVNRGWLIWFKNSRVI